MVAGNVAGFGVARSKSELDQISRSIENRYRRRSANRACCASRYPGSSVSLMTTMRSISLSSLESPRARDPKTWMRSGWNKPTSCWMISASSSAHSTLRLGNSWRMCVSSWWARLVVLMSLSYQLRDRVLGDDRLHPFDELGQHLAGLKDRHSHVVLRAGTIRAQDDRTTGTVLTEAHLSPRDTSWSNGQSRSSAAARSASVWSPAVRSRRTPLMRRPSRSVTDSLAPSSSTVSPMCGVRPSS